MKNNKTIRASLPRVHNNIVIEEEKKKKGASEGTGFHLF